MRGAMPPHSQYAFMAWCSVKAEGHIYLYLLLAKHVQVYENIQELRYMY